MRKEVKVLFVSAWSSENLKFWGRVDKGLVNGNLVVVAIEACARFVPICELNR